MDGDAKMGLRFLMSALLRVCAEPAQHTCFEYITDTIDALSVCIMRSIINAQRRRRITQHNHYMVEVWHVRVTRCVMRAPHCSLELIS